MRTLRRSKAVATIAAGLVIAGGGLAYADNLAADGDGIVAAITNQDWAVGSVCTGSSGTRSIPVAVVRSGNSNDNTFANGSSVEVNRVPSGLTVEAGPKTISIPGNWQTSSNGATASTTFDVTYTAPLVPGPFSGTVTFTGIGINISERSDKSLTKTDDLKVSGTAVACDTTPPVITPNVVGTIGDNDWYTSDVALTWSVVDDESTVSSLNGCDPVSITADQAATSYTCAATSAGGAGSQSVTLNRDATNPHVSGVDVVDTTWRNMPLSANFTASDAPSGLADATDATFTLTASTESAGPTTPTTASKTVTDNAGNSTTRTLSALIDKTAPAVSVTGVANGGAYTLGSLPTVRCSTSDALSGVAQAATVSTSGTLGSVTTTCSGAQDNAGNVGSASVTYAVRYAYSGFFQPIDNNGVYNKAKAGSTIPVKFSLGGDQGLSVFAAQPVFHAVSCSSTAGADAVEEVSTATTSGLKFDAANGQYIYNWKTTAAMAGTCQKLTVRFTDGTSQTALFNLTK